MAKLKLLFIHSILNENFRKENEEEKNIITRKVGCGKIVEDFRAEI